MRREFSPDSVCSEDGKGDGGSAAGNATPTTVATECPGATELSATPITGGGHGHCHGLRGSGGGPPMLMRGGRGSDVEAASLASESSTLTPPAPMPVGELCSAHRSKASVGAGLVSPRAGRGVTATSSATRAARRGTPPRDTPPWRCQPGTAGASAAAGVAVGVGPGLRRTISPVKSGNAGKPALVVAAVLPPKSDEATTTSPARRSPSRESPRLRAAASPKSLPGEVRDVHPADATQLTSAIGACTGSGSCSESSRLEDLSMLAEVSSRQLEELEEEILARVREKQALEQAQAEDERELRARLRQVDVGGAKEERALLLKQHREDEAEALVERQLAARGIVEGRQQAAAAAMALFKEREQAGAEARDAHRALVRDARSAGEALVAQRRELLQDMRKLDEKRQMILEQKRRREAEVRLLETKQQRTEMQRELDIAALREEEARAHRRDSLSLESNRKFENMLDGARVFIEARKAEREIMEKSRKQKDREGLQRQEAREKASMEIISRLAQRRSDLQALANSIQEDYEHLAAQKAQPHARPVDADASSPPEGAMSPRRPRLRELSGPLHALLDVRGVLACPFWRAR
eukprot:TRINITY_DN11111_c0_g1_i3.p1 TRINITY_DN11111_c0_g1~~TRINITY_DN11111_c0_g1_i3.p1  ORF type:complete len:601 (-),score=138.95 TRINITY_DN11111_c0_g1_i3:276-2030(-)